MDKKTKQLADIILKNTAGEEQRTADLITLDNYIQTYLESARKKELTKREAVLLEACFRYNLFLIKKTVEFCMQKKSEYNLELKPDIKKVVEYSNELMTDSARILAAKEQISQYALAVSMLPENARLNTLKILLEDKYNPSLEKAYLKACTPKEQKQTQ